MHTHCYVPVPLMQNELINTTDFRQPGLEKNDVLSSGIPIEALSQVFLGNTTMALGNGQVTKTTVPIGLRQ